MTPFQSVKLFGVTGRVERLAVCSHLRDLTDLYIRDASFDDQELHALSRSGRFLRLASQL